jgi:cytochrome P450
MSHLTADIICRTVFSTSLDSQVALDVFEDFTVFERSVAQVDIKRLIFEPAWTRTPQPQVVLDACARIRGHLATLIDTHLAARRGYNDIASAVIAARDADTGEPFTREELIDQLGVFFLAGHETTASVLTWLFFICAERPELVARMREEIDASSAAKPMASNSCASCRCARCSGRPCACTRRSPSCPGWRCRTTIGPRTLPRGALVMISPWTLHRHRDYWKDPHASAPSAFCRKTKVSSWTAPTYPSARGRTPASAPALPRPKAC